MVDLFDPKGLKLLYKAHLESSGEENGQVTIIGGSKLFHGAPLLSLKVASRIVDMVFLASPESSVGGVAERIKSKLLSFIWVPWEETEAYIEKSDAVLIGPGFMRYKGEKRPSFAKSPTLQSYGDGAASEGKESANKYDEAGRLSREITERFLKSFPNKKWVIDAGSLQVMDADWIPKKAILTPNRKEFEMLFRVKQNKENITEMAKKYHCIINSKGPTNVVCSAKECVEIKGGNPGLTKGGTGDVLAGLVAALLAKNEPFLAASAASYITKAAADELFKKVGTNYNADDLVEKIPEIFHRLTR